MATTNISKLVSALAAGARASNGLPTSSSTKTTAKDDVVVVDDDDDVGVDEFAFHASLPEFGAVAAEARGLVSELMRSCAIAATDGRDDDDEDDDETWRERCVDAQDDLLDRVEAWLRRDEGRGNDDAAPTSNVGRRDTTASAFRRMVSATVDMVKPQKTYDLERYVDNSRETPWRPPFWERLPEPLPGHGLLGVVDDGNENGAIVAPATHYPHPLRKEIETFVPTPEQLSIPNAPSKTKATAPSVTDVPYTWVDTESGLEEFVTSFRKEEATVLAVDLEHHSHRSFHGLLCLAQASFRDKKGEVRTFLVDVLALPRPTTHRLLLPVLTDPAVVKVLHGARSDVLWLQRDLGLYVVNLFDTGAAARRLGKPSCGLAYALRSYVGVDVDASKARHQLADWRVRPLSDEARAYAANDTHWLLDVYDATRRELGTEEAVRRVVDDSRALSLSRYRKEPFRPRSYQRLLDDDGRGRGRRGRATRLSPVRGRILRALYDWRDATARARDESLAYVCPDRALTRLALAAPTTVERLTKGTWWTTRDPAPAVVLEEAERVVGIVERALEGGEERTSPRRVVAPDDDDDGSDDDRPRRTLAVHPANAGFDPSPPSGPRGLDMSRRRSVTPPSDHDHDQEHVEALARRAEKLLVERRVGRLFDPRTEEESRKSSAAHPKDATKDDDDDDEDEKRPASMRETYFPHQTPRRASSSVRPVKRPKVDGGAPTPAYDYDAHTVVGLDATAMSDNPFFAGAAKAGASNDESPTRKRSEPNHRRGDGNHDRDDEERPTRRDPHRSIAYRPRK